MRGYTEFAKKHNKNAWEYHWGFVRQHIVPEIFVGAAAVIASFMLGVLGVLSDWKIALYVSVGAVVLMWLSIILWSIFSTSYRLWVKDGQIIGKLKKEAESAQSPSEHERSMPNITIEELFDYIHHNSDFAEQYPVLNNDDVIFKIGQAVKDNISIGRLSVWGREYGGQWDDFFGMTPLKKIELDSWDEFSFTYNFLYYDPSIELSGEADEARKIDATNRVDSEKRKYRDLQFNNYQAKLIWLYNTKLKPDATMSEAIDYLINILFPDRDRQNIDYQTEFPATVNEITAKLRTGELKSWGLFVGESVEREFNKYIWKFRELLPLESSIPTEKNPQTKSVTSDNEQHPLTGIRVNINQAKSLWREN